MEESLDLDGESQPSLSGNASLERQDRLGPGRAGVIRIGIADDHPIVRAGLKGFLEEQEGFEVVGEVANGREAMDLVRCEKPDVLLIDLFMPHRGGADVLESIRAAAPEVAVLFLSAYPEEHYAISLVRRGAQGYLSKGCDPEDIVRAIRTVAQGQHFITPAVADLLAARLGRTSAIPAHETLSDRELQIFLKLARGCKTGEIARELSLSVKTISTGRNHLLRKMEFSSNAELTHYAVTNRLLS